MITKVFKDENGTTVDEKYYSLEEWYNTNYLGSPDFRIGIIDAQFHEGELEDPTKVRGEIIYEGKLYKLTEDTLDGVDGWYDYYVVGYDNFQLVKSVKSEVVLFVKSYDSLDR